MTFVFARRFGDLVYVYSDSMLSGRGLTKPNIIPGRLKSIVLNKFISLAFAGTYSSAWLAVRRAEVMIREGHQLEGVLQFLKSFTKNFNDDEFIVISTIRRTEIFKISDGRRLSGFDHHWLGDPTPLNDILKLEEQIIDQQSSQNDAITPAERFSSAAIRHFLAAGTQLTDVVGGFIFIQLCSPHGHCYLGHAGVTAWDTTLVPPGVTQEQQERRDSGMTQYSYNVLAPLERGVPVVGTFLPQANLGYIFSPLEFEEPEPRFPATLESLRVEIADKARKLGGFISEVDVSQAKP